MSVLTLLLLVVAGNLSVPSETWAERAEKTGKSGKTLRWKKVVLDTEFRSEGVAVADVNRDGRPDVLAGLVWYEAPGWKMHEIGPAVKYDAAGNYSDAFINFTADLNRDGWPDLIRIDWPGRDPAVWHENPKGASRHWPEHRLAANACNESPYFGLIDGAGPERKLIFAVNDEQMFWLEPGADLSAPFRQWPISPKFTKPESMKAGVNRYSHGLGYGDIDMDGIGDLIIPGGYWKGPKDPRSGPWTFVKAGLGQDAAHMHVYDVNGDGLNDVLSSSAHKVGIWWHEQRRNADGTTGFTEHLIDESVTQTHALELVDLDGDGLKDLITGKRYWAHGPKGDLNPDAPPVINWYQLKRSGGQVQWTRHEIDNDSGIGTQFLVTDLNRDRRLDIVTSNKHGVHAILQQR
ncbi:MAG: FG-GAP repeat domain-containing protein [Blastocatellia bacterium]|jgi:hypothetical protein